MSAITNKKNNNAQSNAAAYRATLQGRTAEDWINVGVSLCIPRVFANIGYKRIKNVFIRCGFGFVERVDTIRVIPKNGAPYKRAYVHFAPGRWNLRNPQAMTALEHMVNGNHIELTYEDGKPWFWKISLSQARKPDEAPKPKPAPQINLATTDNTAAEAKQDRQLPQNEPRGEVYRGCPYDRGCNVCSDSDSDRRPSSPPRDEEKQTDPRELTSYANVSEMDQ